MKSLMKGPKTEYVEKEWPNLTLENHRPVSPEDPRYNCIAWAAEKNDDKWWPLEGYYWPPGFPIVDTLESFVNVFVQHCSYQVCPDGNFEEGFQKVAIYMNEKGVAHAARQLDSGKWTSKMGVYWEDIEHNTLESITGPLYGQPVVFLKKRLIAS